MNEPQETQVSIRLTYALIIVFLITSIASLISYRLGKGQAYKEIVRACIENKIAYDLCFLASEEALITLKSHLPEKR